MEDQHASAFPGWRRQLAGVAQSPILRDGAHSMEIDLLVCVSDGVLGLEAKTWSGFISGLEAGPIWT